VTRCSSSSSTRRSSARTKPPVVADPASACSGVAATAAALGDLLDEPREAHHARTEDDPAGGELVAVALDVGERRHDEDRLLAARQRGAIAVEHDAGLLGVGRAGDDRQGHRRYVP
jgi:hypothetical protein